MAVFGQKLVGMSFDSTAPLQWHSQMKRGIVKPARKGQMSRSEWGLVMQVEWLARLMWVAMATEKRDKNATIEFLSAIFVLITI
jgi:hypothetical protein